MAKRKIKDKIATRLSPQGDISGMDGWYGPHTVGIERGGQIDVNDTARRSRLFVIHEIGVDTVLVWNT